MGTFRARAFLVSAVLSAGVVAAVMFISFLVVTGRMAEEASLEAGRHADASVSVVRRSMESSIERARREGLSGTALASAVDARFKASLPSLFAFVPALPEIAVAVYAPGSYAKPEFSTGMAALVPDVAGRQASARGDAPLQHQEGGRSFAYSVFSKADLGSIVVHSPVTGPGGMRYVVDTVYLPLSEEEVIDLVRPRMIVVSIAAAIVTMLLMQTILNWLLRAVNDLRRAAESIGAGELDVKLPDEGTTEIAGLARAINSLIDRLRRGADAQTRFVADASHELATPVAGIRGYVNILRGWGADDPTVREEAVAAIDRESRRMARLTTQLLELIRSDEVLELHSVRHDINGVVRAVLEQAGARYAEKRLELVGPDPGQLVVFGDPERLEDVLYILVDNAAKYTPEGGRVSVQTYRRKGDVVIEVSDTGAGIPAEDLTNIFDRFYRSDLSRSTETGGFGLGLSIAKRIVDTSGGLIDVRSQVGRGTTFTIRLPRGRD